MEQLIKTITEQDNEVKKLIEKLREVRGRFYFDIYEILKAIYEIRKNQISNYNFTMMAHEKGMIYSVRQIKYIYHFSHMSDKTKSLIEEGILKPSTFLSLVNRKKILKIHEHQDLAIKKFLNNEFDTRELNLPAPAFIKVLYSKDKMPEKTRFILSTLYTLRSLVNRIIEKKHLISKNGYISKLKYEVSRLNQVVKELDN